MPPTHIIVKTRIPIAFASRVVSALSKSFRYEPVIIDEFEGAIDNPVSAQEYIASKKVQEVKDHVIAHEVPDLAKDDRQERIDEINAAAITVEITQE